MSYPPPAGDAAGEMSPMERAGLRLWRMLGVGSEDEVMDCVREFQSLRLGRGDRTPSSGTTGGPFSFEEVSSPAAAGGASGDHGR